MSVEQPDDYDPQATVWGAVSNLEKKAYTRREIFDALRSVADNIRPEGGFNR